MQISQLDQYGLRQFRDLFASLAVPEAESIRGKYHGAFVGPAWVKAAVKPALWITGLGGWWGKEIYEDGTAINLVLRRGKFSTRFSMKFVRERSFIDGRHGLALHYQQDNPVLWLFIVDEIRRMDESTLLGMTRPSIPGLRWFALPFILQKQS
jgi:hypothetical protein